MVKVQFLWEEAANFFGNTVVSSLKSSWKCLPIINSIDNEVPGLVNNCEFVKELMDYLEYLYSDKGYASRIYKVL